MKSWWAARSPRAKFLWIVTGWLLAAYVVSNSGGSKVASSNVTATAAQTGISLATLAPNTAAPAAATAPIGVPTAPPTPAPTRTPDKPFIGDQGRIHIDGVDNIIIASTQKDLEALRKALAAHDVAGAQQLALQGGAFLVANDTKILVIDWQGFLVQSVQVRILNGPMTNRAGWTEPDWVVR